MFTYELNNYLTIQKNNGDTDFKDVYFNRNNKLELNSVYFIVSKHTASAAELLINSLRPYMEIKLIAEQSATYGKPVGSFEKKILNRISFLPASFKLINAVGVSNYWNGITADKTNTSDYGFNDFGDQAEPMISAALDYAAPTRMVKAAEKTPKYKSKSAILSINNNSFF